MPYVIKKVPGGYKLKSEGTGRYFSSYPMTYEAARNQQKAVYAHVTGLRGGKIENDFISTFMNNNDLNNILNGGGSFHAENKVETMSFSQIEHLINHEFRRAGWMILAKHHGHHHDIDGYKKSLKEILTALMRLHQETESPDKKMDINKLYKQIHILHNYVENNL